MIKPEKQELRNRIEKHLEYGNTNGNLAEISIAWDGYIAALLEWGFVSVSDHAELSGLLPQSNKDTITQIFLGIDPKTDG